MSSDSVISSPKPQNSKKIKKLHVRHYPPGFQVEFHNNEKASVSIPREILTYLTLDTLHSSAEKIVSTEQIFQVPKSKSRQDKITNLIVKCLTAILNTKSCHVDNIDNKKYKVGKILKAHVLPLTNVAFNKSGSLFLTGSYDRTAKIWPVHHLLGNQFSFGSSNFGLSSSTSSSINSHPHAPTNSSTKPSTPEASSTAASSSLNNFTSLKNQGEPISLEGHKNVVYTLAFNNPFGDKVATGSFDRTAKIWETSTGRCLQTLRGHSAEVVCLGFNSNNDPHQQLLATGSMDSRCGIWKVSASAAVGTGDHLQNLHAHAHAHANAHANSNQEADLSEPTQWLAGHSGDVIALNWEPNENGTKLITGSFDRTAAVWDINANFTARAGSASSSTTAGGLSPLYTLIGHREEISSVFLDYCGSIAITGSMDQTARIWDLRSGKCVSCLRGHSDEVLDVAFSHDRCYAATGGADCNACLYDLRMLSIDQPEKYSESISSSSAELTLEGHKSEISQIKFNPASSHLLTVSADSTAKIWKTSTGELVQSLEGHSDEIFSCAFNYNGDTIITGSKDNTCRIWTLNK